MEIPVEFCYKSCGKYIVKLSKLPDTITNEKRDGILPENRLYAKYRDS